MRWGVILTVLLFILPGLALGTYKPEPQSLSQSPTGYLIMPVEGTLVSTVIAAGALVFYFTRGKKKPKKKTKNAPKKKKPKKRAR